MAAAWEGVARAEAALSRWVTPVLRWPGLPWAIIGFGVLVRLARYLADFSLEVAESQLALNLVERSFADLLSTLDYDQAAPVGFLFAELAQ